MRRCQASYLYRLLMTFDVNRNDVMSLLKLSNAHLIYAILRISKKKLRFFKRSSRWMPSSP